MTPDDRRWSPDRQTARAGRLARVVAVCAWCRQHRQMARVRAQRGDGIERLCIERGLKMTGQRRTIARVLTEASDHPDVEELYRRAVLLDPRICIATVYRAVRLFEEKGILQRRDFGNGRARYEPTEHGPHHHLIDIETGKGLS